jgi:CHAT domain-containing protein
MQSGNREVYQKIPLLSYIAESKLIKAAAQQSGHHIRFLRQVATQANFIDMLSRKPKVLHISCHGIKNTKDAIGASFEQYKQGELVSAKQLRKLIRQYGVILDLVFVAACKSEFVGRIF